VDAYADLVSRSAYDRGMGALLGTTTRVHRIVDRLSSGRLGRHFPGGAQVVWIYTRGRRTGTWRRYPLLTARESDTTWVIAGSNSGQARVPGWVYNISAYDQGWIDINGEHWSVRFEEVEGADRDAMYGLLVAEWKAYASYARRSPRYIPVFRIQLLDRVSADALPPRT